MINDAAYWISLAHMPGWGYLKTNALIIKFFHENKLTIEDFFQLPETDWQNSYGLELKDLDDIKKAKTELANNAFLAETLDSEGYELIPITSPEYSKTLKENLKAAHAPSLLYVKGNKQILTEKSIAIVGSRTATDISLEFTDNIARLASREYKVVVSGFAKGVDKQALDSAILHKGQSIIVLPQGIMTFGSGYKTYYKQIVEGDVLVLSTFHPKAPWRVELAMARNPIIYGLASEIYVAESSEKGGTWSGVIDGLRKERKIFVRKPEPTELNANNLLIQKGAVAVDLDGKPIESFSAEENATPALKVIDEPVSMDDQAILILLKRGPFTAKDIISRLGLSISESKLSAYLKAHKEVEIATSSPIKFTLKADKPQKSLFE